MLSGSPEASDQMTIVNSLSTLEFAALVSSHPRDECPEDGANHHPVPGGPEPTPR